MGDHIDKAFLILITKTLRDVITDLNETLGDKLKKRYTRTMDRLIQGGSKRYPNIDEIDKLKEVVDILDAIIESIDGRR